MVKKAAPAKPAMTKMITLIEQAVDTGGGGYNWTGFGIEGGVFTLITKEKNNNGDADDLEELLFYIDLCQSKLSIQDQLLQSTMYLINCFGIHLYTFSTSGHQTVLPAYIGVCGVAPWPVTLSTWVTTVVFCISQLRNYIYRESMLMGILNGIKRERSTNKLKPVVNHISSAAKFNIPIIPDISSISRLKTTACIKPFTLF